MFPKGFRKVEKKGFHANPVPNAAPKYATSTIGQQHPSPKGFRKVGGRAPIPMPIAKPGITPMDEEMGE